MAKIEFNPFTGKFDLTGGGGASYIDDVVDDPTQLPVTIGTPPLDAVYLSKGASGMWLINRRPAGLYCRTGNLGVAADWTYLGAFPEVNSSANWSLYDGTTPSKELKFDLTNVPTASTVTLTAPSASGTIARTEDFAAPPAIGSTTPAAISGTAGTFTTLTANTSLTLNGTGAAELINGTSAAGDLRIYRTTSSANANYERGFFRWGGTSSNTLLIGTEKLGTGAARPLVLQTDGATRMTISAVGRVDIGPVVTIFENTAGMFLSSSSQINFNNGMATSGSGIACGSGVSFRWKDNAFHPNGSFDIGIQRNSAGMLEINNGTAAQFRDLVVRAIDFGGATSSFPALNNSGTTLQVRLADDTGFAPLACGALTLNGNLDASTRDIVTDITTGTKIGTATTQKIGFFNATPVDQPALTADLLDSLQEVGLIASGSGDTPLNLSGGTLTAGNLVLKDNTGSETATFDAQGKLTDNRTYDLPDASGTLALLETLPAGGSTNLWIPASAWIPKTTAGCGVDSRETTTNDQNFDELLFDTGSDEFADALVVMPSNYNNGTITARFYWTAASGSGGVAWAIQGRAFANDDALDTAAGTAQLVTDTLIAANDMHITSATSAVTIGGTPAANTPIQFTIYRDVSDAGDDLAVDARLLGVEIIFN